MQGSSRSPFNGRALIRGCGIVLAITMIGATGCNYNYGSSTLEQQGAPSQSSQLEGASGISLSVVDRTSGTEIYSDSKGTQFLSLVAGKSYLFQANVSNMPSGASVKISATNTSLPGATPASISSGGTFDPPSSGEYAFKVSVVNSANLPLVSRTYSGSVSCQNPTLTAADLDPSKITVSGSNNIYSFSAPGIVTGPNGQPPYLCAYDLTGVGIVDTPFVPCDQPLLMSAFYNRQPYVNYVDHRNIGVVVKDSCNTSFAVSHDELLAHTTPSMPGNVFITGQISNETGTAATDPRIKGVSYLATNTGGYNIVSPRYSGNAFSIQAYMNYYHASSVYFGMNIDVAGLGGTFNLRNNINGTIDTSGAYIKDVSYTTDRAGDQNPSVTLTSTTCTTTGIQAKIINPQGVPCASTGDTGSNNQATVEVWGDYSCTNAKDAGGSVSISGQFDGYLHIADNCVGGGGGGGGGIVPIQL